MKIVIVSGGFDPIHSGHISYLKSAKNSFLSEEELSEHWETLQYLSKPNFKKSQDEYAAFQTFFRGKNISKLLIQYVFMFELSRGKQGM